jgi:hypothetical protein
MSAGLLVLWFLLQANAWFPVLRLESAEWNVKVFLASQALFWLVLGMFAWRTWGRKKRGPTRAFMMGFSYTAGPRGDRTIFVPVDGSRLMLYTSNCGAECGVGVRLERPLGAGLLLVRMLPGFDRGVFERYEMTGAA